MSLDKVTKTRGQAPFDSVIFSGTMGLRVGTSCTLCGLGRFVKFMGLCAVNKIVFVGETIKYYNVL